MFLCHMSCIHNLKWTKWSMAKWSKDALGERKLKMNLSRFGRDSEAATENRMVATVDGNKVGRPA